MQYKRGLGVFSLAMINVAAIVSLRNLPMMAEFGCATIFFLVLAALVFFLPIAFVTAELAAAWPEAGGNYIWVSAAFGRPCGFFALWASWMESISWFPTILTFTAAMLAHMLTPIIPGLEHSKTFIVTAILIIFWGATIINFFGINVSGWISTLGVVIGTLVPGVFIVMLGFWWIVSGHPLQVEFSLATMIPDFRLDNIVIFSGVLLGLAGIELAAYHVVDAKDPQRDYPRAVLLASLVILTIYILGTLAIVVVVPRTDISLASGLIQAISLFFASFGWAWMAPLLATFLLLGALAGINTWIVGPAKGMLVVAKHGLLPSILTYSNKKGVPVALLLLQAAIGSILALVFLYIEDSNGAIWILLALSAQFTFIQYLLVFAAVLKLRYFQPNVARPYKAPCIWILSGLGIAACVFSFFIVYLPPAQLNTGDASVYRWLLLITLLVLALPPILFSKFKKA